MTKIRELPWACRHQSMHHISQSSCHHPTTQLWAMRENIMLKLQTSLQDRWKQSELSLDSQQNKYIKILPGFQPRKLTEQVSRSQVIILQLFKGLDIADYKVFKRTRHGTPIFGAIAINSIERYAPCRLTAMENGTYGSQYTFLEHWQRKLSRRTQNARALKWAGSMIPDICKRHHHGRKQIWDQGKVKNCTCETFHQWQLVGSLPQKLEWFF